MQRCTITWKLHFADINVVSNTRRISFDNYAHVYALNYIHRRNTISHWSYYGFVASVVFTRSAMKVKDPNGLMNKNFYKIIAPKGNPTPPISSYGLSSSHNLLHSLHTLFPVRTAAKLTATRRRQRTTGYLPMLVKRAVEQESQQILPLHQHQHLEDGLCALLRTVSCAVAVQRH